MIIKQFNGNNHGTFYIQCKGLHSGRPLEKAIPNCFTVFSDDELLKEKIYALFVARLFEPIIIGSVIPFIRIYETKQLIEEACTKIKPCHTKHLKAIGLIDDLLKNKQMEILTYRKLQKSMVFDILK